jgi:hypothetical protein
MTTAAWVRLQDLIGRLRRQRDAGRARHMLAVAIDTPDLDRIIEHLTDYADSKGERPR